MNISYKAKSCQPKVWEQTPNDQKAYGFGSSFRVTHVQFEFGSVFLVSGQDCKWLWACTLLLLLWASSHMKELTAVA